MRTLAIGDIHGCNTALETLLKRVRPAAEDRLVFLGDYIDRGPASRQVIDTLLQLETTCQTVFIRGNHEAMILGSRGNTGQANLWKSCGGLETLFSYGANYREDWASMIAESHWQFIERTARYFETERNIFVHGCLEAELELKDQPDSVLLWDRFEDLKPHISGKRIICGHTPQPLGKIKDIGFAVCIDTAAATGGWLTCLDVDSGKYWQANEQGNMRESALS